jgi:NADH-quinone oxidoreductase subunit F
MTVELVKKANLRGSGRRVSAGMKWSFLPKDRQITYLCVNADESEPPTFSNRVLMESDPHLLLEGILIAGYATRTAVAYIYLRGEFMEQFHILQRAVDEAYAAGYFGQNILGTGYNLECYLHRGAGAYICGEETGLIESLEGKRLAADQAAVPSQSGRFRKYRGEQRRNAGVPAADLFCRARLVAFEYREFKGHRCTASAAVQRPAATRRPLGLSCRELIYQRLRWRMRDGRKIKAVFRQDLDGRLTRRPVSRGRMASGPCRVATAGLPARLRRSARCDLLGLGTAAAAVVRRTWTLRH